METKRTALLTLLDLVERKEPIMPDMKRRLLEMERKQLTQAYNTDPELMKIRFKNDRQWLKEIYGI